MSTSAIVGCLDGFVWEIPAGPMTFRYTAVVRNGVWREVGDRIVPDKEPVRFAARLGVGSLSGKSDGPVEASGTTSS